MKIGDKATDFNLKDEDEQTFTLSKNLGKWVVLYFYPKDNTPGCTTEALEFTAALADFTARNTVVVGVSPDSCQSHQRFKVKHDLGIRLLADPDRQVMKAYGAWADKSMYGKTFLGVVRSTVLIDPQGRIAHHWPKVKAQGHAAAVKETLAALQSS